MRVSGDHLTMNALVDSLLPSEFRYIRTSEGHTCPCIVTHRPHGRETRMSDIPTGTRFSCSLSTRPWICLPYAQQNWFYQIAARASRREKNFDELLLERNLGPDFVEDRGHEFGSKLSMRRSAR